MSTRHKGKIVRFHVNEGFSTTGVVADNPFTLLGESRLRVVVRGAGASNILKVQAKIDNDTIYTDLLTLTGNGSETVDISTYDNVRFNVTTYDGSPGTLIVSGFHSSAIEEPLEISGAVTGSFSPVGLTEGGVITSVNLSDVAWVAVPPSTLLNRNSLTIQNISGNGGVVLWNYVDTAPSTVGYRIEDGGFKSVAIRDTIVVYARMLSGIGKIIVDEVA